jgi:serine/threonine protein kinase, bacterial
MGFAGMEYGRMIGRYSVVRRLSVGGMAEIFLALAAGPGEFRKFVTLKRILPDLRDDDSFVRMFLEEARISAALSHANIAQVFDLRSEDDELYLAMEYVPGEDISRILRSTSKRQASVPIGLTSMVVRDTCNALNYAHNFIDALGDRAPVVHRDVSLKNVMVTYSGAVKIVDFGIAKMVTRANQIAASTGIKGSSGYMSPEQIEGKPVDGRSDLFSLGVVMHELLSGRRLFMPDELGFAMPDPILITPPHFINPAVPEALSAVAMRALEFDPSRRFASAREMARAVEEAAPEIYDEERTASFMRMLFANRIEMVRTLLRSATAHPDDLRAAAAKLDEQATPRPEVTAVRPTQLDALPVMPLVDHTPAESLVHRPLVLAVDDSVSSLHVLKIQLGRVGLDVITASTPIEAFEQLASAGPEAIILDVVMPEMTGFEMCRIIRGREAFRHTPILFLSAACSLEERIRGLEVGGDDFIRKPCDPQELAVRVRLHLARVAMLADKARS